MKKKFKKVIHKINFGKAVQGFPGNKPISLAGSDPKDPDCSSCGYKRRVKMLESGVRGKSCKAGLEDMSTLPTVQHVYVRQALFIYNNFKRRWFHPWEFENDMMNNLAAANPQMFFRFFLTVAFTLQGFIWWYPVWSGKENVSDT